MFPLLYLDPGTGSLLLYALIGVSATAFFALRGLWYSIKGIFVRGAGSNELPKEIPPLVIHSEGAKYWQVFQPVLEELDRRGIPCAFVTPDKEDFSLSAAYPHVTPVHPGNELATIAYMNRIRADLVITTTPHLDIYMLKRSKHVRTYAHLFHAPTSVDVYEKFAFNRFDVLLSPGPFMEPYVRELEAFWNLPEKRVIPVGCTYYDFMKEQIPEIVQEESSLKTILYAPTWGARSSILKYGLELFEKLDEGDFHVIFRPHPQYYVSHKEEIEEVEKWIADHPSFTLDRKRTGLESMAVADLMITDLSGIIFDFAYLFEKPILLMDAVHSLKGYEGEVLTHSWNLEMSQALSRVIREKDIPDLVAIINESIGDTGDHSEKIRELRDKELTAFGNAASVAVDGIVNLLGPE